MDIVIIANFTGDFTDADNIRFKYLAQMLADTGSEVEVLTSSFDHFKKCPRKKTKTALDYKVRFIKEPGYPKNVCIKRFYSHRIWGKNVLRYLERRKKPDVIYCAVPSLTGPLAAAKFCEKNGIRFVVDVQDLWPEAFQMVVNVPVVSDVGFAPFKALADGIYKRADAICSVSDTYGKRALSVNKKCKGYTTVYLGTDLDTFDSFAAQPPILQKKDGEIWLAYCGTLGSSYDLTCVFDALAMLDDQRICFIVMGDGPREDEFRAYAKQKNVNAVFTGRLDYNEMCSLLNSCDITVNPIVHNAAQSIINKHADYAASGLPVLSTQENREYKALVRKYKMGFNCKNNDAADLADKLKLLANNETLRRRMGENARRCAQEKFDRKTSYAQLIKAVFGK